MTDYIELQAELEAKKAAGWQCTDGLSIDTVLALIAENEAMAGMLQRFVDGEHDQDENQAERHMYFTEAQSLLALVSGELEAHTIVPDSAIKAIHAERDLLKAENEALRNAAGQVLLWIEAKHRPPVSDQLETGRMALVRLHALADLDAAMGNGEQS